MVAKGLAAGILFLVLALSASAYLNETANVTAPLNGSLLAGNATINVSFFGSANVTIEYNITLTFAALNATYGAADGYLFPWNTSNGSFADNRYGLRVLVVNESDATDNATLVVWNLTVDNTPPNVSFVAADPYNPLNDSTEVNITANVTDPNGVGVVQASNGSSTVLMTLIQGTSAAGLYSAAVPLSTFSCGNDSRCYITVLADDDAGNTNGTEEVALLYTVTSPPVLRVNTTNVTAASFGENVTVAAWWQSEALVDFDGFNVAFSLLDTLTGAFASSTAFSAWTNDMLARNWTNATFHVNGSREGRLLTFRVLLNDSYGRNATTDNLTVTVGNSSPNITVMDPANNSYISAETGILIQMLDRGAGINLSSLAINVSTALEGFTLTYAQNASLFDCACDACGLSYSTATWLSNDTCALDVSWLDGNFTLNMTVRDLVGNANGTTVAYQIITPPEIVNITVYGHSYASSSSVIVNLTNASREATFNWSVNASGTLNATVLAFLNETDDRNETRTAIPAIATYNLTAGKSYLRINATLVGSPLEDTVEINLTANVPLNLSALKDQYTVDPVTWQVFSSGADISSLDTYVNATLDIVTNVTNTSGPLPFTAAFNYSRLDGLTLRWNGSADAFAFRMADAAAVANLSNVTWGNVTIAIEHAGQMGIFLDGQRTLVAVTLNASIANRTAHYQLRNASATTYLLGACAMMPSSAIAASASCYETSGDVTTFYLPRFEEGDRLVVSEPDARAPNVTIVTNATIAQSILPLSFTVATPNPNATLCDYNLSRFNATTTLTTAISVATVLASQFTAGNVSLAYRLNVTAIDGLYNLTVTCWDAQGESNTTRKNINLTDTTRPNITSDEASGVSLSKATVTGRADEQVTFTVKYGTNASSLSDSLSASTLATTASIQIEDLDAGTTYYFNLTGCDAKGLCGTSDTKQFTTSSPSEGGSGGGGGGGEPTAGPIRTDSRFWKDVAAGDVIDYAPTALAFSRIVIGFATGTPKAIITIKQYDSTPLDVPQTEGVAYKYLSISHTGLEGAESYRVEFEIPKAWVSENGIDLSTVKLYRLEGGAWRAYGALQIEGGKDDYAFSAAPPGFSWFAIAGQPAPEQEPVVAPPAAPVVEAPAEVVDDTPTAGVVSALGDDVQERSPVLMIAAFVIVAIVLAVGGLQAYKLYQRRESAHAVELVRERERYALKDTAPVTRAPEHDPMAPLQAYIAKMRAHGYDDAHIRARLRQIGWDSVIVEEELQRKA